MHLYLLKRHLFQQLLWSMTTNSKLSTAFAMFFYFPVFTWGEGRDVHCTGCQHLGARGQHICILLGGLTASRAPKGISVIQREHFTA